MLALMQFCKRNGTLVRTDSSPGGWAYRLDRLQVNWRRDHEAVIKELEEARSQGFTHIHLKTYELSNGSPVLCYGCKEDYRQGDNFCRLCGHRHNDGFVREIDHMIAFHNEKANRVAA